MLKGFGLSLQDRNGAKGCLLFKLWFYRGDGVAFSAVYLYGMPDLSHVMHSFRPLPRDRARCRVKWTCMNSWTALFARPMCCHAERVFVRMSGPFTKNRVWFWQAGTLTF